MLSAVATASRPHKILDSASASHASAATDACLDAPEFSPAPTRRATEARLNPQRSRERRPVAATDARLNPQRSRQRQPVAAPDARLGPHRLPPPVHRARPVRPFYRLGAPCTHVIREFARPCPR